MQIEFFYLHTGKLVPNWMVEDLLVDHTGSVYEKEGEHVYLRTGIGWRVIDPDI